MHLFLLLFTLLTAKHVNSFEECEGQFCPPSVPKPRQLSFGNVLGPLVGLDPETGCFCREVIEMFSLCYGRDRCTSMTQRLTLRSKTFKLTNTHIKILGPSDFQKLGHLIDLQIEGNYDLERILNGTFRHLHNLVNLSIAFNTKLKTIERGAFEGLTKLEHLFLNNNGFESLYGITLGLTPQLVPRLVTLILDSNSFFQVRAQDFQYMANSTLEELSLNLCRIEYIHPKALLPLNSLQRLHLGENSVNSSVLTDVLAHLISAGVNLKSLNLFFMGFKKAPPKELMEIVAKSNISQLNLSKNQFEVIDRDSFPWMPNLSLLDLREVLALQITDDAFVNVPNLKTLLISGNRLSTIPKGVLGLRNLTFLDMQENSPSQFNHLYFSIKDVEFTNMTKLLYLNLGFNGLAHLFNTSFEGLKNLQVLILKNSSLYFIKEQTFALLKELRMLNLGNNIMAHGDAVPDVFFALTKLESLDISGCKFKYISRQRNPFSNLKSLKYLSLDKNLLKTIEPTDFQPLISLQKIDLSYNLINSWEKRIFSENRRLSRVVLSKNKLSDLTFAMLEDFAAAKSVDVDQNAIQCKCLVTYKSYKSWYRSTKNDILANGSLFDPPIFCGYPDQLDNVTVVDFLTKKDYGDHICSFKPENIFLLLPLVCTILFFAVLGVLAFWYRWHIKYWIFLSKLYLSRKGKLKPNRQKKCYGNYEYDAFVSYSTEDRDFVVQLVAMMENQEPFLKLCVYERDFLIGTIITESVLESVAKSRKTVLVISENYARSQWCKWESQICEHHRLFLENEDGEYVDDSLILIKLTPVSEAYLTPTLKYLLKTRIYLPWGEDQKKQVLFWNKLRSTLRPPNGLHEITHM